MNSLSQQQLETQIKLLDIEFLSMNEAYTAGHMTSQQANAAADVINARREFLQAVASFDPAAAEFDVFEDAGIEIDDNYQDSSDWLEHVQANEQAHAAADRIDDAQFWNEMFSVGEGVAAHD